MSSMKLQRETWTWETSYCTYQLESQTAHIYTYIIYKHIASLEKTSTSRGKVMFIVYTVSLFVVAHTYIYLRLITCRGECVHLGI